MNDKRKTTYDRQYKIGGKVPPYSQDAEDAILGCILLNNKAMAVVSRFIGHEDFYVEKNRMIFKAMMDVQAKSKPIDEVTVGTYMMDTGQLQKIGGAEAFGGLTDKVATIQNVEHYARQVKEMSARREMIYAAQDIVASGFGEVEDTSIFLSESRKRIVEVSTRLVDTGGPQKIDKDVHEVYKELESGEMPSGLIRTGIEPIDRNMGGLWPEEMVTVAGRPGMGKSAFSTNIMTNVSIIDGRKVLVFSLEETRKQIVTRMLARFADINITELRLRSVHGKEKWSRIIDACSLLTRGHNLWVEQATGLSSAQIAQVVSYYKEVHGIELVMIDHLSEVREIGESETVKMTNAARGVRDICKSLGLPVMLLAQLNREVERRPNKRPLLSDLRQSGEVEQLSRTVMFLYRPAYYDPTQANKFQLELLVPKANNGPTGTLRLYADMSRMFITGWDTTEHGLWHNEKGGDEIEARQQSRKRSHEGESKQGDFFGGNSNDGQDY